jgi:hypothetical protein
MTEMLIEKRKQRRLSLPLNRMPFEKSHQTSSGQTEQEKSKKLSSSANDICLAASSTSLPFLSPPPSPHLLTSIIHFDLLT